MKTEIEFELEIGSSFYAFIDNVVTKITISKRWYSEEINRESTNGKNALYANLHKKAPNTWCFSTGMNCEKL